MSIEYRPIDFDDVGVDYQSILPFPLYKRILAKRDLNALIGIEAVDQNKPVGCLIVEYFDGINTGTVLAWEIDRDYQQKGIGSKLYSKLSDLLPKPITLTYYFEDCPIVRGFLKKLEWSEPKFYIEHYHMSHKKFHPDWFEKGINLPADLKMISWRNISAKNRSEIERQEKESTFEISVSPFGEEENIDLYSSLALMRGDEVVGWMVNHFYNQQTIKYSALYIERELRNTGAGIAILAESIRLNQKGPVPLAIFEINLNETDPTWKRFVRNRLKPSSVGVSKVYASTKLLKQQP